MTLKVIGAGIGRTGTSSLKIALETLGFGKCYHMSELAENISHVSMWVDAADGKTVHWDTIFDGYQSTVDMPTYAFYADLMKYYPEAKVILTLRDPEEWFKSASQTIFRFPGPGLMLLIRFLSLFNSKLKTLAQMEPLARKVGYDFFDNDLSKDNAIRVFNRHYASVQENVPAARLLIYEVQQGWDPLCAFLNVPIPDEPFPHANTRAEFGSSS